MRKILFLLFMIPASVLAQTGGEATYQILQFQSASRVAVLNNPIAVWDHDVNLGIHNPSLLNPKMHHGVGLNFVDYFADINLVSVAHAFPIKELGTFGFSLQSLNLGTFTETNSQAQTLGTFTADEQLMSVSLGKQLFDNWSLGASVKLVLSNLESYQSVGLATDLGATYYKNRFAVSILAKNVGRQISTYATEKEPLPFELKLGVSKKLEHIPFLFSIGYNHIENWDLTYDYNPDISIDPLTGEENISSSSFTQKLLLHFDIAGELSIGKFLQLRAGYNPQRRYELKVDSFLGMVGFSWGLGIKVSHFYINYGRATYHLTGSPNYFSIKTNLSKFYKKK
jgi:hypothetical protein